MKRAQTAELQRKIEHQVCEGPVLVLVFMQLSFGVSASNPCLGRLVGVTTVVDTCCDANILTTLAS